MHLHFPTLVSLRLLPWPEVDVSQAGDIPFVSHWSTIPRPLSSSRIKSSFSRFQIGWTWLVAGKQPPLDWSNQGSHENPVSSALLWGRRHRDTSEIRRRERFGSQPEIFRVTQLMLKESIILSNLNRTFQKEFCINFPFYFYFYSTIKTQLATKGLTRKKV